MANTVQDSDVHAHLALAEAARSKRQFRDTTNESAIALAIALSKVRRAVVGSGTQFTRAFVGGITTPQAFAPLFRLAYGADRLF